MSEVTNEHQPATPLLLTMLVAASLVQIGGTLWLLMVELSLDRDRVVDDAYITYTYARHWAEGFGIRYNILDAGPTDGGSSFLHMAFAKEAIAAGFEPLTATKAMGLVLLGSLPFVLALGFWRVSRVPFAGCLFAGSLFLAVLALFPETVRHLNNGMETILFASLCASLCAWALHYSLRETPAGVIGLISGAALLAAVTLTRPEGMILAAGVIGAVSCARFAGGTFDTWRTEIRTFAILAVWLAAVAGTYLYWKISYFGDIFPNAYWVKSDNAIYGSGGPALPGFKDVTLSSILRWMPLVTAACVLLWVAGFGRRILAVAFVLAPFAVVHLAYLRAIHEVAGGFRYAFPLYTAALVALGFAFLMVWNRRRWTGTASVAAVAMVLVLIVVPHNTRLFKSAAKPVHWATGWVNYVTEATSHARAGLDLKDTGLGSEATVLLTAAGLIPYHSRMTTIDQIGLNNDTLSGKTAMSIAEVWDYIEGRNPDAIVSFLPPATPGVESPDADPAFAAPIVAQSLDHLNDLVKNWNREKLADSYWREMVWVRDNTEFGACYYHNYGWVLSVYVRKDSPHRDKLLDTLRNSKRSGCDEPGVAEDYINDPRLMASAAAAKPVVQ